jgi:hypothetical protein
LIETAGSMTEPQYYEQIVLDFDVGRTFIPMETFAPPTEYAFSPWIRAINAVIERLKQKVEPKEEL